MSSRAASAPTERRRARPSWSIRPPIPSNSRPASPRPPMEASWLPGRAARRRTGPTIMSSRAGSMRPAPESATSFRSIPPAPATSTAHPSRPDRTAASSSSGRAIPRWAPADRCSASASMAAARRWAVSFPSMHQRRWMRPIRASAPIKSATSSSSGRKPRHPTPPRQCSRSVTTPGARRSAAR